MDRGRAQLVCGARVHWRPLGPSQTVGQLGRERKLDKPFGDSRGHECPFNHGARACLLARLLPKMIVHVIVADSCATRLSLLERAKPRLANDGKLASQTDTDRRRELERRSLSGVDIVATTMTNSARNNTDNK